MLRKDVFRGAAADVVVDLYGETGGGRGCRDCGGDEGGGGGVEVLVVVVVMTAADDVEGWWSVYVVFNSENEIILSDLQKADNCMVERDNKREKKKRQ